MPLLVLEKKHIGLTKTSVHLVLLKWDKSQKSKVIKPPPRLQNPLHGSYYEDNHFLVLYHSYSKGRARRGHLMQNTNLANTCIILLTNKQRGCTHTPYEGLDSAVQSE